uniref:Aromatic-L-amino-acid decarboxylase n=1 Tax=Penaeus vannamei TaxID=6689 RepID=A0A6H1V5N8_PENVA|nr:DOPA decarboxylase [Penaeus vannamei]
MDSEQFRAAAREMTDYVINYLENIRDRRVLPEVEPGYLRPLLPSRAPDSGEPWADVMADIERVIMPGVTHWHSPQFHAYFPTANSYPALLADMLCGAIGCIGFTWISSPACTELEVVMMDWLGQLLGLPKEFLAASGGTGGGVIQGTASEATLVAMLSARSRITKTLEASLPDYDPAIVTKFVCYSFDQAHSSVERASLLAGVKMRKVISDDNFSLRGPALRRAIQEDKQKGLIPFFVVGTIGATPACSFDNLREIGEVAQEFGMWHHVDAAYAGSALVCEEYRYLMDGVEYAHSIAFNDSLKYLYTSKQYDSQYMQRPGMAKYLMEASDFEWEEGLDFLKKYMQREGNIANFRSNMAVSGKGELTLAANEDKFQKFFETFTTLISDAETKFSEMNHGDFRTGNNVDYEICHYLDDKLEKNVARIYELKTHSTNLNKLKTLGVAVNAFDSAL